MEQREIASVAQQGILTSHAQFGEIMTASGNSINPSKVSSAVQIVEVQGVGEGQRIDNYLLRHLKGVPKSKIYRIIRKGEVRVNKKRCKPDSRVYDGDAVRIPPIRVSENREQLKPSEQLRELLLSSILYEDGDALVINKPAGLSVHGGSGIRLGLIEALRQLKEEWSGLELAHRLDRGTSGCLVMAKNPTYLNVIQDQFRARTVTKVYHALVHGLWPGAATQIDAPLQKNELLSGERVVRVSREGKSATTRFRVIQPYLSIPASLKPASTGAQTEAYPLTLVEAMPLSGRTHQIRVHCLSAGCPILGDDKYAPKHMERKVPGKPRLCLHAQSIRFHSSDKAEEVEVIARKDRDFESILASLTPNT